MSTSRLFLTSPPPTSMLTDEKLLLRASTACVLAMGAYICGHKQVAVYDGSWAEWATTEDSPVATGPA